MYLGYSTEDTQVHHAQRTYAEFDPQWLASKDVCIQVLRARRPYMNMHIHGCGVSPLYHELGLG